MDRSLPVEQRYHMRCNRRLLCRASNSVSQCSFRVGSRVSQGFSNLEAQLRPTWLGGGGSELLGGNARTLLSAETSGTNRQRVINSLETTYASHKAYERQCAAPIVHKSVRWDELGIKGMFRIQVSVGESTGFQRDFLSQEKPKAVASHQ